MCKKKLVGFVVCLLGILALSVISAHAQTSPPKPTKPITLTFNWEGAYGRANCLVWPFRPGGSFEQLVTKHTEGLVKLDIKEKLYGLMESVFAIGDGRVQMGTQSIPAATGTYPLFDFGGIPGFIADPPHGAYQWAEAFVDPKMMAIWDKYSKPAGFKVLGASISLANNCLWSNKPIKTLADFKGIKIRTSGRTQTSTLRTLGASPVTLSMAEVEDALYRGTVDSITTSKSYGSERGLIDLCKFAPMWPVTPVFAQCIAINAKVWDGLHPFLKEGLLKAGAQLTREMAPVVEQMEVTYTLWIRSSKCQLIIPEPSEVKKAMELMKPVVKEWLDMAGPYGKEVLGVGLNYATGPSVPFITEMAK
ncbi:MAG: TRAP transporter substrate-binding protein DctP [Deltaproteobacteria bacterium]|nr:TRAP transporter substrate-binding protein DctP [Deltaproteobacteria bacterium]